MKTPQEFSRLVRALLDRFQAQNGEPALPGDDVSRISDRLWILVEAGGLPPPLAPDEAGAAKEFSDAECTALVQRVVEPADSLLVTEAVRQLVKTCFYPEFRACRESYRALSPDGACRRQDLARARRRVSGSHCVDCPYWLALAPLAHAELLATAWHTDAADFGAHREVFLPEDYRALRVWIREQAR